MLRKICGITKLDKIRNERIREKRIGEISKEIQREEIEMVRICYEKG